MNNENEAPGIPESNASTMTNIVKNPDNHNSTGEYQPSFDEKKKGAPNIVKRITEDLRNLENEVIKSEGWESAIVPWDMEISPPDPLVHVGGELILSRANIAVITGGKKSLKSTLLSTIVASCISSRPLLNIEVPRPMRVLFCDTEQGLPHIGRQMSRMVRLGELSELEKHNCTVLNLRPFSVSERKEYVFTAARVLKPDLICIDGAADLVMDTNDLAESESIVASLLTLTSELNCGILTVVHSVPGGTKTRGHLGSTLERKAESVIYLGRDEMEEYVKVKEHAARNKPFEPFLLDIGEYGDLRLPMVSEGPKTAEDWLIYLMEPGKEYLHKELVTILGQKGFSRTSVSYAINKLLPLNRIKKTKDKYSITLYTDMEEDHDNED